jgi:hypothetical protein
MKLLKRFGIHEKDAELKENERLRKHLEKGGYIAKEEKVKKPKK